MKNDLTNLPTNTYASKDEESMEAILRKLIAFPTVSDDFEANHEALQYVAQHLRQRGMYIQHIPRTEKNYEAFIASTRPDNAKEPNVLLAAHIDVMAADEEMFTLTKRDDKYFGRGVLDMKSAIVSYLRAIDDLQGPLKEYDFAVLITSDEEIGGRDGINTVRQLVDTGYRPKFVVLPDGGQDWQLETISNGYIHLTLEAKGKTGHSSRPWLGDNAAARLIDALHECKAHFKDQGPDTDTFNLATIQTSVGPANQIPDFATAEVSIRVRHLGSLAHWLRLMREICEKYTVQVIERAAWDVTFNGLENEYVGRFAELTEQVTGVKVTGFHSYAGSDARFFAELGIPYANGYPTGGGHHSKDEWIAQEALPQMAEIVRRYLELFAK